MDPTQTLERIRVAIGDYQQGDGYGAEEEAAHDLIVEFLNLDEWMSAGGLPPDQWRKAKLGRPRLEQDGPVLEGVEHGKRSSYNAGCHCMLCRAANARGAAMQRERVRRRREERTG